MQRNYIASVWGLVADLRAVVLHQASTANRGTGGCQHSLTVKALTMIRMVDCVYDPNCDPWVRLSVDVIYRMSLQLMFTATAVIKELVLDIALAL